ncbi:MAG TPA: hypothetical protein VFI36_01600 [Arthrobacter sp.]|nr:hypothetical protein [Arthrobacter sp.]
MRKRTKHTDDSQWTSRDEALWTTAEIAVLLNRGDLEHRHPLPVPFAMRLGGLEERILAHGPFRLFSWTAPGDGSYIHNTSMMMATGRGGLAMMAGFAAARAIGNSARRRQAEAMAQPQWMLIDQGTLSVGNFGFYLHSASGIPAWNWGGVHAASLAAPGRLNIDGMSESGPVKWVLHSDWAELVFLLWASVCSPHHPQMTGRTWLPEEWLTKAMVFSAGNPGHQGMEGFREIMAGLR